MVKKGGLILAISKLLAYKKLEIVRIYTPVSFAIKIPFTYVSPIPGVIF